MQQTQKDPWSKEEKLLMMGATIPADPNKAANNSKAPKSSKPSQKPKAAGAGKA